MNMDNKTYEYVEDRSMTIQQYINNIFKWMIRSVYKELHADHETGAADNK